jgi:hypothetical protein
MEWRPEGAATHETANGAEVSMPTWLLSTKKATLATVAGNVAAAFAERVTFALPVRVALADGFVIDTVKPAAATVRLTAADVERALLESTTRAVRAKVPEVVGVQFTV